MLDISTGKIVHTRPSFFSYFKDFIERSNKGTQISPRTRKSTIHSTNKGFTTTYNHLENFQRIAKRKIDFDIIDLRFHSEYTSYLT
ncbi:phage integrase SAM-like domain-containing protein [Chitinophaga dinghuensis]|uniref:phage integrase SAM-like domain-containing protein n=1 Tax=Chitinophaga dinghuensis TaxID=1539050 RepID=UPI000DBA9F86